MLSRARKGDTAAAEEIFRHFIPADEEVVWVGYLGRMGLFFGRNSLACLTNKRIADITLGWFGEIVYQDALLEYVNSTAFLQPSRLLLYLLTVFFALAPFAVLSVQPEVLSFLAPLPLALMLFVGLAATLLVLELCIRLFYALSKCGVLIWIKEGLSIYMFCDRGRTAMVNRLLRCLRQARDERVASIGHLG